jgi:hypothetical protein
VTTPSQFSSFGRVVVIVPTYNNAGTLPDILERILKLGLPTIVVDDGSTDQTKQILADLACGEPRRLLHVIAHAANRGKAAALQTGFAAAIQAGYTHAVTIDSDGQLDPEEIPTLLQASAAQPRSFVVGMRDETRPDYPTKSRFGRRFSNAMVYLETGVRVVDSQCGFRVYPLGAIGLLRCGAGRFGYETEVITRAVLAGCEIAQVPVNCRYFEKSARVTHFKPIRDSLRSLAMHARLLLAAGSAWPHPSWRPKSETPSAEPGRFEWAFASLALLCGLVLRLLYAIRHPVNSDEPQHLHVAWGWSRGLVQYRDLFDNHAPLFHVLFSPLVRAVGERPELFLWARLAMIPLVALTLVATYLAGRSLYGRRTGLWAAVLAGLLMPMFIKSVEFRTDDLWAMCWMWAIAVLVAGALTPARGFWGGVLIGLCAGVSMKTTLLLSTLGLAASATALLPPTAARRPDGNRYLASIASMAFGVALVPLGIVLWFKAHNALQVMLYGTTWFNLLPNDTYAPDRRFALLPALVALLWFDYHVTRQGPASAVSARRRVLFLTAGLYFILDLTAWPIVRWQDFLPAWPMLGIVLVGAAQTMSRTRSASRSPWHLAPLPAFPALAAVELGLLLLALPHGTALASEVKTWQAVLRLTSSRDYVMDEKGELLFRRRAYYYELETIARARLRQHLLPDNIPQSMVRTNTLVVGPDLKHFPPRDRAFIEANYISVGPLRVAGQFLGPSTSNGSDPVNRAISFEIRIPAWYSIVDSSGPAQGSLDALPISGPRFLGVGPHTYQPSHENVRTALVLAKAIDQGFQPF